MKNLRLQWQKLPSGLVLGVNVCESALSREALRTEAGAYMSMLKLDRADRAAVWAVYAGERAAVQERIDALEAV